MLNTLGIVQPRSWSPSQGHSARRLGGKSLLEWVVRRATDCQRLDRVIVALGSGPEAEILAELVPHDVPVFLGGAADPLRRTVAAIEKHPAQAVVLIGDDTPFVDPELIDRLVTTAEEHPACDYLCYASGDGRSAVQSSVGLFAEWCRADALRTADAAAVASLDRQMVTRYLRQHPEQFTLRLLAAPTGLDAGDVRLQIDSEEDWEHAQTILDALGPERLDWQRIAGLLEQHPALRKRMATLNRRPVKV